MSIQSKIQKLMQTFDYEWYKKLKEEFEAHPLYTKKTRQIEDEIRYDPFYDEDGELVADSYFIEINVDIYEFSWNGFQDFELAEFLRKELVTKGKSIAENLKEILDAIFYKNESPSSLNIDEKRDLIVSFLEIMSDGLNTFKKTQAEETEYPLILEQLSKKVEKELFSYYKKIMNLSGIINKHKEDHLQFEIKENQLGVLLAIISKAGFIYNTPVHRDFYAKYFLFKKGVKKVVYKPADRIKDRINDAQDIENPSLDKARKEVKGRLLEALKKF